MMRFRPVIYRCCDNGGIVLFLTEMNPLWKCR